MPVSTFSPSDNVPKGFNRQSAVATRRGWVKTSSGELLVGHKHIVPFSGVATTTLSSATVTDMIAANGVLTAGQLLTCTGVAGVRVLTVSLDGRTATIETAATLAGVASAATCTLPPAVLREVSMTPARRKHLNITAPNYLTVV